MLVIPIRHVYCDGGVVGKNPSPHGGTWAYCHVTYGGERIYSASGSITPADTGLTRVTNNYTELLAALLALESMPDEWEGNIWSDSKITIGRINKDRKRESKFTGIPENIQRRIVEVKARLGAYKVHFVKGHPTKEELARGKSHNGRLVSEHNVFCDKLCQNEAVAFMERLWEQQASH